MEQNNALARKFNAASLLRFALPNIAMMMLLSMYTIVDGMFISRFAGTTALSAINMSYPLNCLQMATGIMLGTGGSAGVPPYVIFSNATLADMAAKQTSSEFDLLSVRGVGDAKARRYGKEFLAAIQKYRDENLGK